MPQLKVATFNVEWMIALFGGIGKGWRAPSIPRRFEGKRLGLIRLAAIDDVHELCRRIAGVMRDMDAHIIGIQEGPPLKQQLQAFVSRFLDDDFEVYQAPATPPYQTVCALVRKDVARHVREWQPTATTIAPLWEDIPYYPWGKIGLADRALYRFSRTPLLLEFEPDPAMRLRLVIVHAKSAISRLKTPAQWLERDKAAVLDALSSRVKLSAEMLRLRRILDAEILIGEHPQCLTVMGDFNDGPFMDLLEQEFFLHGIVDELIGTIPSPETYLKHAMRAPDLAAATTVRFADPLKGGALVDILLDHILVSPAIWYGSGAFRVHEGSCQVERAVYDAHNDDTGAQPKRQLRPSDHRPVGVVFDY